MMTPKELIDYLDREITQVRELNGRLLQAASRVQADDEGYVLYDAIRKQRAAVLDKITDEIRLVLMATPSYDRNGYTKAFWDMFYQKVQVGNEY